MVDNGVEAGLRQVARAKDVHKAGKLTAEQERELLDIVKEKSPRAFGYEQHVFTAAILVEIVRERWDVDISDQTVYNLFHRHGWSYQRAHRDYANADSQEQQAFALHLQDTIEQREEGQEI